MAKVESGPFEPNDPRYQAEIFIAAVETQLEGGSDDPRLKPLLEQIDIELLDDRLRVARQVLDAKRKGDK